MARRLFAAFTLAASLFSVEAFAQGPAPRTVSLAEVIRRAKADPPAVLSALATLERSRRELYAAQGAYYPKLTVQGQAGYSYYNQPYIPGQPRLESNGLSADTSATLDVPLFDRTRGANVNAAEASAAANEAALHEAERQAISGAVSLYFDAVAARALIADAQLTFDRRTTQYNAIAELSKGGVRARVDEQRAKIEAVSADAFVRVRMVEQQQVFAALASALGMDPLAPVEPAESEAAAFVDVPGPNEAVARAEKHRPELRQAEANLHAVIARDQSARARRLPTLGIAGNGSASYLEILGEGAGLEGASVNASVGFYLRWSAIDVTTWRQAEVTSAQVLEAEKQLDAARLRVRSDVVAQAYATERTKVMLERAEAVLAAAEVTRKSQNERFSSGIATLLELLDAEEQEQTARINRITAQRDYDAARSKLAAAMGEIDG